MKDELRLFILSVCQKPRMHLQSDRYETVCAYLDGYDDGRHGAPLRGFREWLLAEGDEWTNLPWWGLIRRLEFPADDPASSLTEAQSKQLLRALGGLMERFLDELQREGLGLIFHKYHLWLMSRDDDPTDEERTQLRNLGWPSR